MKAGKPEEILPRYLHPSGQTLVVGHSEVASEEARHHQSTRRTVPQRTRRSPLLSWRRASPPRSGASHQVAVEAAVKRALGPRAQLRLLWGASLLHWDDCGLRPADIPTVFTNFKNKARYTSYHALFIIFVMLRGR